MTRADFRQTCVERDGGKCLVPACDETVTTDPDGPGSTHHIIERKLWSNGGYIPDNGASVCNEHHRLAEDNIIPPQAFWRWAEIDDPPLPEGEVQALGTDVDKWGKPLPSPKWQEYRKYIKYPSTRHLPWSHEQVSNDSSHKGIGFLLGYPLVATTKMDGSNCMLVADADQPIRARNGRHADKDHFDLAKQWYWQKDLYNKLSDHYQVFGEWLYAKHSIHYGCDCDDPCEDVGPALRDYFQVFGIYDTRYSLWLGWHETKALAQEWGLTMVPRADSSGYVIDNYSDDGAGQQKAWDELYTLSQHVVENGHEGIVVRSALPFHYGQIGRRLGKYVRPDHVKAGEKHWSKRQTVQNLLRE